MTTVANHEIVGVRMKLSSPEKIRELSKGEVKKPETINYRTLRPEKEGLFCERIFGPTRSYECACGKYKRSGPKFRGVVCEVCGVEITDNRVRRERMGHIELAAPVVHIWYLRGIPSRLSLLLGTPTRDLEKVVYFAPTRRRERVYKVINEGRRTDLVRKGDLVNQSEEKLYRFFEPQFKAEEAFRITRVDEVPFNEGDIVSADKVAKARADFGDEFTAERAYSVKAEKGNIELGVDENANPIGKTSEKIVPESELDGYIPELCEPLTDNKKQEMYVITRVKRLPFAKNDVISESEYKLYNDKYARRFQTMEETETLEEPCYLVIDGGESPYSRSDIILECQERICAAYDKKFEAGIGAEGVYTLLTKIDINLLSSQLRDEIAESTGQKKRKLVKRLQVVGDFLKSGSRPEWMVLSVLPVIPPDLRPMVQLDGGRFATSDLNDLYRRVINRNNRLRRLKELRAPEIIVRNEKRMLQESVDALIDNGRRGKAVLGAGNRPLKSLTDLLRGKKGRFRQNLLGKRVDYSGRSVIVIGPYLKFYQCGIPKQMALELFKPFVMHKLVENGLAPNVKSARRFIDKGRDEVWGILEEIIKDHPVMLNRAPTLHRLGIQAFEPVLVEGKALRLHPLVCTAFNADFDGDQMAIHVPLSLEAQTEARVLMLSSNNLLSPASGKPIVVPTQDMILGIYYITTMIEGQKGEGMFFRDIEDVISGLDHEMVEVNTKIYLKNNPEWNIDIKDTYKEEGKWIETCPGRVIFNMTLKPEIRFINEVINKKNMSKLLDVAYDKVGQAGLVEMLDKIKSVGYHWSTLSGISLGVGDIIVPPAKKEILDEAMKEEDSLTFEYDMGVLTEDEYLRQKDILWSDAGGRISDKIMDGLDKTNPLFIMVDSGARGSRGQVAQMAGIRGLMADPSGKIIGYPITANFVEGLNTLQYFISTHGARKGLADTALRTAKSGYLTRRLVDVAQDLIITEEDCGTHNGIEVRPLRQQDGKIMIPMSERLEGRIALEDLRDPETGELLLSRDEEITNEKAKLIESRGIESVMVRSPLTCGLRQRICRKCYGRDLSTRGKVAIGEAVGVVAAQSIGEPGTQLTLRTFHTGGVHTSDDITQGLPRIEQLFEVRRPKKVAILAEVDGILSEIKETDGKRKLIITVENEQGEEEKLSYNIPLSQHLRSEIVEGAEIRKGMQLTEGYIDPQQLLEVEGLEAVQHYLLDGIQDVYRSQGVAINDKHIETILRKVAPINRVRVAEEGDSTFVSGELVWKEEIDKAIKDVRQENDSSLNSSFEFLDKYKVVDTPLARATEDKLSIEELREIVKSGSGGGEIIVEDEEGKATICVGEAAFRHAVAGQELMEDFIDPNSGEVLIEAGKVIAQEDAAKIISVTAKPETIELPAQSSISETVKMLEGVKGKTLVKDAVTENGTIVGTAGETITDANISTLAKAAGFEVFGDCNDFEPIAPISVRNTAAISSEKEALWLSADIKNDEDKIIVKADTNIDAEVVELIKENNIDSVRVWKNAERFDIDNAMHHLLIEEYFDKPISMAIDAGGQVAQGISRVVDGAMVRALVEGTLAGFETEGEIVTRDKVVARILRDRLSGKVLLENIADEDGSILAKAGEEIGADNIDKIATCSKKALMVRSKQAASEARQIISRVSFIRRLREEPTYKPIVLGVTKAALATESFLSAASFQQTAQVLASAAVRGDVDDLRGLKENVIIGILIPAGTGIERYNTVEVSDMAQPAEQIEIADVEPAAEH